MLAVIEAYLVIQPMVAADLGGEAAGRAGSPDSGGGDQAEVLAPGGGGGCAEAANVDVEVLATDGDSGGGEPAATCGDVLSSQRSKSQEERDAAKGKPAGNPGRFQGDQRDFLQSLLPAYMALPRGKRGKNKDLEAFWNLAKGLFWKKFTVEESRAAMGKGYEATTPLEVITQTDKVRLHTFDTQP